jgi:hypothetical protein
MKLAPEMKLASELLHQYTRALDFGDAPKTMRMALSKEAISELHKIVELKGFASGSPAGEVGIFFEIDGYRVEVKQMA